jgi:hypothetical protein
MLIIKILLGILCIILVLAFIGLLISVFKTNDKKEQEGIYGGMAVCVVVFILSYNYITGGGSDKEVTKKEDTNNSVEEVSNNAVTNESEDVTVVNENEDNDIVENTLSYLPINKNIVYTTSDKFGESVTEFLGNPQNINGKQVYVENAYSGLPYTEKPMKFYHILNENNDILTVGEENEDGNQTWYIEPEIYLPSKMVEGETYKYTYQYTTDLKGKLNITFIGYEDLTLQNGETVNCIVVERKKGDTTMIEYYAEGVGSVLKINDESKEKVHEFLNMGRP